MLEDNRVVVMKNGEIPFLVMFFSICNDPTPYARKETFNYYLHNPAGDTCFVERMEAKRWNKEIRKQVDIFITSNFPYVKYGAWVRTKSNGNHIIKVRSISNVQHPVSV